MKKIDGTLYSPVVDGEREKMYVETVSEAVIMADGSTLKEKLVSKSKGLIVSTEQPETECMWLMPLDSSVQFDFSDVDVDIPEDDTKIHTLKTPADSNGIRQNVYPLTSAKNIKVNDFKTLNDIFIGYDMGFEVGKNKPDHKATWCIEEFKSARINEFGKPEEVLLLNGYPATDITIGDTEYTADEYIFNIDGDSIVVFNPNQNDEVVVSQEIPNKQCLWFDDLYHVYPDELTMNDLLLNNVVIEGQTYIGNNKIINYQDTDFVFFNPNLLIISDKKPRVRDDRVWANTGE